MEQCVRFVQNNNNATGTKTIMPLVWRATPLAWRATPKVSNKKAKVKFGKVTNESSKVWNVFMWHLYFFWINFEETLRTRLWSSFCSISVTGEKCREYAVFITFNHVYVQIVY